MKNIRGYILITVTAIVTVCMFLLLGLVIWSQQASILSSRSRTRSTHARLVSGMNHKLLETIAPKPEVSQTGKLTYQLPEGGLTNTVNWDGTSKSRGVDLEVSKPSNLFDKPSIDTSYFDSSANTVDGLPVPQWHHLARQELPNGDNYVSVISTAFPLAAYAPWGKLEITGGVNAFSNPHFTQKDAPRISGVPLWLHGYDDVTIVGSVGNGKVESFKGKVSLGQGGLAVGYQGRPLDPAAVQSLTEQVTKSKGILETLRSDTLDKTQFITESFLSPEGLWDLFTGKGGLSMIFSLRQACSIPFPLIPSTQDYEGWDILMFHHPYPVDFSGKSQSLSGFKAMIGDLKKTYQDSKKAVSEAWKGVTSAGAGVWDDIKGGFNWLTGKKKKAKEEFEKAKKKYNTAKDDFAKAWDSLKNAFSDFANTLTDLGRGLETQPPVTKDQEKFWVTTGWSYVGIIGHLTEDLGDFFHAIFNSNTQEWNRALAAFVNETRVIHFIDRMPWGGFREDGGFQLGMTWNVPIGRTLKWKKRKSPGDFEVIGDIWLQKGSTLYVDGNLYVLKPEDKSHYGDDLKDPWGYYGGSTTRPTGTVYLEDGASLIVSGDLLVQGSAERGSLNICTSYGSSPAVSATVLVEGDVRLTNGTVSGITFSDLLSGLVEEKELSNKAAISEFHKYLLDPMFNEWGPQIAKLVGPFSHRKCWFARYATTLVFIPELEEFGLAGPWPIPLPYTNCETKFFEWMTYLYKFELNFSLGENLMTATDWWMFGRGMVPVVAKQNPDVTGGIINAKLANYSGGKTDAKSILKDLEDGFVNALPGLAEELIFDGIQWAVNKMLKKMMGDFEDPCKKSTKFKVLSHLLSLSGRVEKEVFTMIESSQTKVKDAFSSLLDQDLSSRTIDDLGEQSGVFLYAGGQLSIGHSEYDVAHEASGFFLSQGPALIFASRTIGAVVSLTSDVTIAGDLYYYPYFTRAFPYKSQKASSYYVDSSKAPGFFKESIDVFKSGAFVEIPKKGTGLSIGANQARIIGEGYVKK